MGNIVDLESFKQAQEPHWAGPCRCHGCGHEWQGVGKCGVVDGLECPSCRTTKGTTLHPQLRNSLHFKCPCGSFAFHIDVTSAYCLNCGERHNPWSV